METTDQAQAAVGDNLFFFRILAPVGETAWDVSERALAPIAQLANNVAHLGPLVTTARTFFLPNAPYRQLGQDIMSYLLQRQVTDDRSKPTDALGRHASEGHGRGPQKRGDTFR